jgi:hypothetical protein
MGMKAIKRKIWTHTFAIERARLHAERDFDKLDTTEKVRADNMRIARIAASSANLAAQDFGGFMENNTQGEVDFDARAILEVE